VSAAEKSSDGRAGSRGNLLRWGAALGLILLPQAVLVALGSVWLWQQGWLWAWIVGALVLTGAGAWLARNLRGRKPEVLVVAPDAAWPPVARAAWDDVEAVARRVETTDALPSDWDAARALLGEVLTTVARRYHPDRERPELEAPAEDVALLVERVASDLRQVIGERVPGAHLFTLGDMVRLADWAKWSRRAWTGYRLARFGFNPLAALFSEARDQAAQWFLNASGDELRRWATGYAVRRAGLYAIEMYGRVRLPEPEKLSATRTAATRRDAERLAERGEELSVEPVRLLLVGQTKAGKSSLVNALAGALEAPVDALPCTVGTTPYRLGRTGELELMVVDTAGYGGGDKAAIATVLKESEATDLIVVVLSAVAADRAADRRMLDDLRTRHLERAERRSPGLVVALTHVDLLRPPREWAPPYDLKGDVRPKARSIAAAVAHVAAELNLEAGNVIPVCLAAGREYNVAEALVPALVAALPVAAQSRASRMHAAWREGDRWGRLWEQARGAGLVLAEVGLAAGRGWLERRGKGKE
jgi:hypothetical protein